MKNHYNLYSFDFSKEHRLIFKTPENPAEKPVQTIDDNPYNTPEDMLNMTREEASRIQKNELAKMERYIASLDLKKVTNVDFKRGTAVRGKIKNKEGVDMVITKAEAEESKRKTESMAQNGEKPKRTPKTTGTYTGLDDLLGITEGSDSSYEVAKKKADPTKIAELDEILRTAPKKKAPQKQKEIASIPNKPAGSVLSNKQAFNAYKLIRENPGFLKQYLKDIGAVAKTVRRCMRDNTNIREAIGKLEGAKTPKRNLIHGIGMKLSYSKDSNPAQLLYEQLLKVTPSNFVVELNRDLGLSQEKIQYKIKRGDASEIRYSEVLAAEERMREEKSAKIM